MRILVVVLAAQVNAVESRTADVKVEFDAPGKTCGAGCCSHANVRPSRDGGRAILNAFELKLVR